ncbi:MAG: VCBS repeat-containing protein [Candidatus Accumulibacter sp.]|uniref:VCBS repeat-containing protein n=1 Tax=Accumulibacter sp. TaxID=2053492 RepID=UPI001A5AF66C|nr:VCBS repeat-containing protein [Accumulibacter sp.]MBL8394023.1 VCBS repeat-containing protein [Accumulibacter sp.]
MRIASSELQMVSSHSWMQRDEVSASLRMWTGAQRPVFGTEAGQSVSAGERVSLSEAGRAAQAAEASAVEPGLEQAENDPQLSLLRAIILMLTGEEARVFDAASLPATVVALEPPVTATATGNRSVSPPPAPAAGYGVEYDHHATHSEFEQTSFSANGVVKTADGQEIRFELELSMSHTFHEESTFSLHLGDAVRQRKDPLVVNFSGMAARLSDQRFRFDLDADGAADSVNLLVSGSGFLVLDRNHDGRINDGSELFGTQSGDGFADLAALDGDGNGWIDENDAAYGQLAIWTPDASGGGRLRSLQKTAVGALGLARLATPFDLRSPSNETLGQIRSSGILLQENGAVGSLQQIDLSI